MGAGLDNAAIAALYERYGYLVARRCRLILRDDGLAEDAVQETFVRVLRYGGSLAGAESPLRWLYRTADRCCFDLLARRREVAVRGAGRDGAGGPDPEPGSAHPSGRLEARDAVLALLRRLGARDRTIAVLAFVDGLPQERIAAEIGTSRVTVNKRLGRIRRRAQALFGGGAALAGAEGEHP